MFYCCLFITNICLSEQRGDLIELTLSLGEFGQFQKKQILKTTYTMGEYGKFQEQIILETTHNMVNMENYEKKQILKTTYTMGEYGKLWKIANCEEYIHNGWIWKITKWKILKTTYTMGEYWKFPKQQILRILCIIGEFGNYERSTCWRLQAYIISRSSQCSTTGVTKAVVCVILSVGRCI